MNFTDMALAADPEYFTIHSHCWLCTGVITRKVKRGYNAEKNLHDWECKSCEVRERAFPCLEDCLS